ncbi:MAG: RNA-dependent RNA polymerase family protein, partial [Candidatus Bathyarchaeota archaeon]|nr:RNA-dependent RNA polymerase family protein [Candidatus Bathyarchaeota archaeon]
CADDYFNIIEEGIRRDKPDLSAVSFETACAGIEGMDFANGLSRSSSPGYPYSQWRSVRQKGGKKAFFGDGDHYTFYGKDCSLLKKDVNDFLFSEESYPPTANIGCIFQDTLKDELISKKKYDNYHTRLVSACPLHVTIAWRMVFLRLIVYLNNKRYDFETGVGVNCVSREWADIKNRLLNNSRIMQDGDQSGFDTSQHPIIHEIIFEKLIKLVSLDEDVFTSAKQNLRNSLIRSTHVCDGDFYRWNGSLPSGHPLTITLNCFYLCIAFRCAWVANGLPLSKFRSNVCLITYGDDSILSVKEEYADSFDHAAISFGMASIGLNYTDALKRDPTQCERSKTIDEISFLKRKFVYSPDFGTTVGPLELESILRRPLWMTSKGDEKELMKARCDDSLLDLVLHGRSTWDEYAPHIIKAYQDEYVDSLPNNTWEMCLNAVREQMA